MNQKELMEIVEYVLENIESVRHVVDQAYQIREYLIDLTLENKITERDFYRISSILSPQSRSPMWQNYFIRKYDCTKISARDDRGDFEKNDKCYEYKASGYNRDNAIHIVQIRLWQPCDYIIQYISDEGAETFLLTHENMQEETDKLKASSAHGTQTVSQVNIHNELRMTIKLHSSDWDRWMNEYYRENPFSTEV